jgi:hypothetical protein
VLVETEDMRRIVIDAADVMTVLKRGGARSKPRPSQETHEESEGAGRPPRSDSSAAPNGEEVELDDQE